MVVEHQIQKEDRTWRKSHKRMKLSGTQSILELNIELLKMHFENLFKDKTNYLPLCNCWLR